MAEVKVKITAQNEVQTGLQASLAQVKQFAGEAQRTMQQAMQPPRQGPKSFMPDPAKVGPVDIGDYGLGPLRQLQEELRKARQASQEAFDPAPTQEYSNGIGGVLGRFALMIGVAASVGKLVAAAFDQLSEAVRSAIGIQEQFNRTLSQAGQASSLQGAISEFSQLRDAAEQTGKVIEQTFGRNIGEAVANAFSGRPGQLMANFADMLTGGAVRGELQAGQEQQGRISRDTMRGNLARLELEADERAMAGGDPKALDKLQREQEKRRQLENLRAQTQGESPQFQQEMEAQLKAIQALEDQATSARERFQTEQEITREKEKQAQQAERQAEREKAEAERRLAQEQRAQERRSDFNQNTRLMDARLRGDKALEESILQEQDFAKGMEATGSFEEAANFAATAAALRAQQAAEQGQMTGSFGASSLQRIGFASNEFFDTRRKEDPSKIMERMVSEQKKTNQILGGAEPLVLPASS